MQSIPMLGVTVFLVLVVTGNLVGAAIYDHWGVMGIAERPFSLPKAIGIGCVILGVGIVANT
jgi:transporter family-2 protein